MLEYAMLEEAYPNTNNQIKKISKKKIAEKFGPDYTDTECCYYDKQGIKMPCCEKFANQTSSTNNTTNTNTNTTNTNTTNTNTINNTTNNNTNNNTNTTNTNNTNTTNTNNTTNNNTTNTTNNNTNTIKPVYAFDSYDSNTYINGYNDNGYDAYVNINISKYNGNENGNGNGNGNDIKTGKCSPLQVPQYHLPVDNKSKNSFNKALETSLNDTGKIQIDKFTIRPYDFDEYSAYANIVNINTNNKDPSLEYRTTPFLEEYLLSLRDNFKKPIKEQATRVQDIEQFTNYSKNLKVDINLYNLFLFLFIGIIIILLCEQITRLAISLANKNI